MHSYQNPWHNPIKPEYGPAFYSTGAKPEPYMGYLIFQRIERVVWDVVKDGVCVTQRAGINGAKRFIEEAVQALAENQTSQN